MARATKAFLERYRWHRQHGGGVVGENAAQAWRAAKAEERFAELEALGLVRFRVEPEDIDPADVFEDERDIAKVRSGEWEWVYVVLQVRENGPCKKCDELERAPWSVIENCDHHGWEPAASVGAVSLLSMNDPYLRVLKAELMQEAGFPDYPTHSVTP